MTWLVSSRGHNLRAIFAVIFLLLARDVLSQEGLKASLAGEAAAEARRRANEMPGYYNLKWDDFQLRLRSSLGIEANDNVTLVQSNREGDILFNPELGITATYPLSQQNTLNLNIDGGYSFHMEHPRLNQFFIKPGTDLSFDFYIKDAVVVNVHDRVSVINQGYDNTAVGGTGNYVYLENHSGVSVTWDLNLVQITGGYDHVVRNSLTGSVHTEDGSEELFYANAGYKLNSISQIGVEATTGLISYDQPTLNGGIQYSAGAFYKARVSQNISLRLTGGYYIFNIDPTGVTTSNNFQSSVDACYGSISLTHQVNSRLNYSVDAGREVQSGLFSDTLDLYYARLQANWGIVRQFPITGSFSYENGNETGGTGEKIERFGYGAGVSWLVMKKLTSSLSYQGYVRHSNLTAGRYTQNEVTLRFSYSF